MLSSLETLIWLRLCSRFILLYFGTPLHPLSKMIHKQWHKMFSTSAQSFCTSNTMLSANTCLPVHCRMPLSMNKLVCIISPLAKGLPPRRAPRWMNFLPKVRGGSPLGMGRGFPWGMGQYCQPSQWCVQLVSHGPSPPPPLPFMPPSAPDETPPLPLENRDMCCGKAKR